MGLWYKIDGTWTEVTRPYVRRGDVWKGVNKAWVKRSGTWVEAFHYDVTPPPPPLVQLELVETGAQWDPVRLDGVTLEPLYSGRYINVSVKMPYEVPDLKRIRVLSTYNDKAPTTQYGGTYTTPPDDKFPNEPWSEYHFNGFGSSGNNKDMTVFRTKTWPRNADKNTDINGPKTLYFTAWAEDFNGNWSVANSAQIFVPKKNAKNTDAVVREARFQAVNSGTVANNGFSGGALEQQGNPRLRGVWVYNDQFNIIGGRGKPTVKLAQIYVQRMNDDGRDEANLYLFWHTYAGTGSIPTDGSLETRDAVKIGTITKGQAKWYKLPKAFLEALEKDQIKGFGLLHKDPKKATYDAKDYSKVQSVTNSLRSGELHVVWIEG